MTFPRRIVVLVLFNYVASLYLLGFCKVVVKRFENCDDNENYKSKFNLSFKTLGDKQLVNGIMVVTAPISNNLKTNVSVEMLVVNQYIHLFSFFEKKSCDAISKYVGEMWYDIERHAQIIPGLCPVAKGRYRLHNYVLDWGKMATLQNFPLGNLRLIFMVYESTNEIFSCFILEGMNQH